VSEEDLPILPSAFDPELLGRLEGQAATIAEIMLARRGTPRPRQFRDEVHPPRGTTEFALLHRMADDAGTFVALLNIAVQEQTDREWRVTLADPLVCSPWGSDAIEVMLHPADLDVSHLYEVPPEVRIYRFYRVAPYNIAELVPDNPTQIAYARGRHNPTLATLREQWGRHREQQLANLLQTVRDELTRQGGTLPREVVDSLNELLTKVMSRTYGGVDELLQAASYLGIHAQVTTGFKQAPSE
jgi:hypothetical protein